eukprot:SAG11_NODE_1184_length_5591_cov_3.538420_3_plen_198_part_00
MDQRWQSQIARGAANLRRALNQLIWVRARPRDRTLRRAEVALACRPSQCLRTKGSSSRPHPLQPPKAGREGATVLLAAARTSGLSFGTAGHVARQHGQCTVHDAMRLIAALQSSGQHMQELSAMPMLRASERQNTAPRTSARPLKWVAAGAGAYRALATPWRRTPQPARSSGCRRNPVASPSPKGRCSPSTRVLHER